MPPKDKLDIKDALNGLGHAVLVFDSDGLLTQYNRAAATVIGGDLAMLQDTGWKAAQQLFKPHAYDGKERNLDDVRHDANTSSTPIRFQILLNGEYTPCWAAVVPVDSGAMQTMITMDVTDWHALTDMIDFFRKEVKEAVAATRGHIDIINSSMGVVKPDEPVKNLTKRIGGFNQLIDMQMFRTAELLSQMERMEAIRTGDLREFARDTRKKIQLAFFMEDFLEDIEHADLLDPETEDHDYRGRITYQVDDDLATLASKTLLSRVLRDMLRNAIMYSMKATPIEIKAQIDGEFAQIDVVDQGYGVREKERDRVMAPFKRARQPQIIAEFGYGLSLYLCKHEVEAMNGRMWYESEEKVGSTFSIKLPLWRKPEAASPETQT